MRCATSLYGWRIERAISWYSLAAVGIGGTAAAVGTGGTAAAVETGGTTAAVGMGGTAATVGSGGTAAAVGVRASYTGVTLLPLCAAAAGANKGWEAPAVLL